MRLLYQIVTVSYDIWSGGVRYFGGKALDCLFGKPEPFVFTLSTEPYTTYVAMPHVDPADVDGSGSPFGF